MSVIRLENYIDGAFVPTEARLPIDTPATGEVVGSIPDSGPEDVDRAARAARRALEGPWGRTSTAERADWMDAIADAIATRAEAFAHLESQDTGKPITLSRTIDIPRAIANFRFFAGAVRHQRSDAFPMPGALNYTHRKPLGVVALITPWNLPLYLLSWKVAPALATGNAVVAKPSEVTPRTAAALAEVIDEIGLPPGVFNLVHGRGAVVGAAMTAHPLVDGVSFTGGTATGKAVGAAASSSFKKLSLELGGKNASIVFADADLDAAIPGVTRAGFANQGQICLCGSRLLIQDEVYDEVLRGVVERVDALRIGDPLVDATQFGSLTSAAHRDKVESMVDLARSEGGRVLTGGSRISERSGAWYPPTVIEGLAIDSRVATEEVFGPVLTVHRFTDERDAIRQANATRYGLAASVWTQNLSRAHLVSQQLRTGMVWVNCWLKRDLRVPFGGVSDSGVGREGGEHSLSFYTSDQNICIQYTPDRTL